MKICILMWYDKNISAFFNSVEKVFNFASKYLRNFGGGRHGARYGRGRDWAAIPYRRRQDRGHVGGPRNSRRDTRAADPDPKTARAVADVLQGDWLLHRPRFLRLAGVGSGVDEDPKSWTQGGIPPGPAWGAVCGNVHVPPGACSPRVHSRLGDLGVRRRLGPTRE